MTGAKTPLVAGKNVAYRSHRAERPAHSQLRDELGVAGTVASCLEAADVLGGPRSHGPRVEDVNE
jgi:hypothetical protein